MAAKKMEKPKWTKATTTYLVAEIFESFFSKQLDNDDEESKMRVKYLFFLFFLILV